MVSLDLCQNTYSSLLVTTWLTVTSGELREVSDRGTGEGDLNGNNVTPWPLLND